MPSLKRLILSLAICASGLLLASCGKSDDSDSEERLRIAVIPKGTNHLFWKTIHAGAIKAAEEEDVTILWKGPLIESDREGQIKVVQNFVTQQVDAIALAPVVKV